MVAKVSSAIRAMRALLVRRVKPVRTGLQGQLVPKVAQATPVRRDKQALMAGQAALAEQAVQVVQAAPAIRARTVLTGVAARRAPLAAQALWAVLVARVQPVQAAAPATVA